MKVLYVRGNSGGEACVEVRKLLWALLTSVIFMQVWRGVAGSYPNAGFPGFPFATVRLVGGYEGAVCAREQWWRGVCRGAEVTLGASDISDFYASLARSGRRLPKCRLPWLSFCHSEVGRWL